MNILVTENYAFDVSKVPDELEEDIRFSILDNNDINNPDFYFAPLIFLESFNSPAIVLNIGGNEITMPIDWAIAIGDSQCGSEVEVIPLTSLNDRGFEAFIYNPITSFTYEYFPIEIVNIYNDVKWYFPRIKNNQLLTVPIQSGHNPHCAFFTKEISKQSEVINQFRLV